jgi:ureidoglycolate lyase
MKLKVETLTRDSFAPYGSIVSKPDTSPTSKMEGLDYWAGVSTLPDVQGPFDVGYAVLEPRPFVQDHFERHMRTPELLMPVDGDMIVVVGHADHPDEPGRLPAKDRYAAFKVPEGVAIIMKSGVWHWAPFPVDSPLRMLVIYRSGTAQDDGYVIPLDTEDRLEIEL